MAGESEIVLYQPDDAVKLEVRLENETVWLTQQQMADLFETTRNNVTLHISNIFKEQELVRDSVCKDSLLTAADGKNYRTKLFGASLKDLGKKMFAFTKLDSLSIALVMSRIKDI